MRRFADDLRWRNLLRILRSRSFLVKVVDGNDEQGLFLGRTAYPKFEIFATTASEAAAVLAEIHRNQLLRDVPLDVLNEPEPKEQGEDTP